MSLIKRVALAIESFAPLSLAGSWDNVGILIEAPNPRSHKKLFLTIDLTKSVLLEALSDPSVGVIVSYHPPIFSSFKRLTLDNQKQEIALMAIASGVSVYSPHTALDCCSGGINDWLASAFPSGYTAQAIKGSKLEDGSGEGRLVTLAQPLDIDVLSDMIKKHLSLGTIRRSVAKKQIQTIGICAGSGSSVLGGFKCDLYFTGEMSHHEILAANAQGTSVILTEHSNSERGYLLVLRGRLEGLLPDVEVVVSKMDRDPLSYY